jgi:hypothetical protein
MRRFLFFLTVLLLGLPIAVTPASASSVTLCDPGNPALSSQLKCWEDQANSQGGAPVLVSVQNPLPLDDAIANVDLAGLKSAFDKGQLVVLVPGGGQTGAGGTLLLLLAKERFVAPDRQITQLDQTTAAQLQKAKLCDKLCVMVIAGGDVRGKDLVVAGQAKDIGKHTFTSGTSGSQGGSNGGGTPKSTKPSTAANDAPQPGSGSQWPVIGVVAAIVALVALLGLILLRSGGLRLATAQRADPEPPGNATGTVPPPRASDVPAYRPTPIRLPSRRIAIPPGPRHRATVRTELHPQGYVEVDHCLKRAVWADPEAPLPALGESVHVVEGTGRDSDLLIAFPPGTGR